MTHCGSVFSEAHTENSIALREGPRMGHVLPPSQEVSTLCSLPLLEEQNLLHCGWYSVGLPLP